MDTDEGRAALRRVNRRGSLPTFLLDGRVLTGFSPARLSAAMAAAAQKRASGM